jgi:hypothetical protein
VANFPALTVVGFVGTACASAAAGSARVRRMRGRRDTDFMAEE